MVTKKQQPDPPPLRRYETRSATKVNITAAELVKTTKNPNASKPKEKKPATMLEEPIKKISCKKEIQSKSTVKAKKKVEPAKKKPVYKKKPQVKEKEESTRSADEIPQATQTNTTRKSFLPNSMKPTNNLLDPHALEMIIKNALRKEVDQLLLLVQNTQQILHSSGIHLNLEEELERLLLGPNRRGIKAEVEINSDDDDENNDKLTMENRPISPIESTTDEPDVNLKKEKEYSAEDLAAEMKQIVEKNKANVRRTIDRDNLRQKQALDKPRRTVTYSNLITRLPASTEDSGETELLNETFTPVYSRALIPRKITDSLKLQRSTSMSNRSSRKVTIGSCTFSDEEDGNIKENEQNKQGETILLDSTQNIEEGDRLNNKLQSTDDKKMERKTSEDSQPSDCSTPLITAQSYYSLLLNKNIYLRSGETPSKPEDEEEEEDLNTTRMVPFGLNKTYLDNRESTDMDISPTQDEDLNTTLQKPEDEVTTQSESFDSTASQAERHARRSSVELARHILNGSRLSSLHKSPIVENEDYERCKKGPQKSVIYLMTKNKRADGTITLNSSQSSVNSTRHLNTPMRPSPIATIIEKPEFSTVKLRKTNNNKVEKDIISEREREINHTPIADEKNRERVLNTSRRPSYMT